MTIAEAAGFRFAPRRPRDLRPRERLLALLDATDQPLVIVRAPGGAGKTTLLATWVRQSSQPGFWVTLDESSGSRLAFWRRVLEAAVDSGLLPDGSVFPNMVMGNETKPALRPALLRGFSGLEQPLVVVLDDYHYITESLVHEDLHWLLRSGAQLRVLLSTRARTPLEEPASIARLDTALLGAGELLFTAQETGTLVTEAGLDQAASVQLHETLGGWPIAIQAALIELGTARAGTVEEAIDRVRSDGIAAVLARMEDTPYLLFLLRTSIASRLTTELAVELAGDDATTMLNQAETEGFGTWTTGGPRGEFVYQPLIRAWFEGELRRRLPEELPRLGRVYACSRDRAGDGLGAIRQYADLGDWGSVVPVVQRHYGDLVLLYPGEARTLLERARAAELRQHPILLVMLALLRNMDGATSQQGLLDTTRLGIAFIRARLGRGEPSERVWMLAAMMGAQRIGGQYEQSLESAKQLLKTIHTLDETQRAGLYSRLPMFLSQAGSSHFFTEQPTRARELYDEAVQAATERVHAWSRLQAESMPLLILAMQGNHAVLEPRLEVARQRTIPHGWRGTYSAAGFHLAEAFAALEHFDVTRALEAVETLAVHERTIEHWPLMARLRGIAALVESRPFAGLQRLAQDIADHEDRPQSSGPMRALLTAIRTDLQLAGGETHRARATLGRTARHPSPVVALSAARVALALGDTREAAALASPLAWTDSPSPRTQAEAFLIMGVAAHRAGRADEARTAVERALHLLDENRLRRPLMMVPRPDLSAILTTLGESADTLLDGVPNVFPTIALERPLTAQERRVIAALHTTGRLEELASELFLSPNTVKSHLRSIYRKLGVSSRDQALTVAHIMGIVGEPTDPHADS